MSLLMKAMLYSTIVFPGSGYCILKCKKKAVLAMGATVFCLVPIFYEAIYKANILSQQILKGELAYDIMAIREKIPLTEGALSLQQVTVVTLVLVVIWLVAICDTYREAKALE